MYEIPFHAGSGGNTSIIIDLKFNGSDRSYPCCLDTGCPYSIIDAPLAYTGTDGDADFNFSSVGGCRVTSLKFAGQPSAAEPEVRKVLVLKVANNPGLTGGGLSNTIYPIDHLARLRNLRLGPMSIDYLPVTTTKTAPPLLGLPFLRHFNLSVDFYHSTLLLDPIPGESVANNTPKLGFTWKFTLEGILVTGMGPQVGAQGLRTDDLIVKVNGTDGYGMKKILTDADNFPTAQNLDLVILRDGKEIPLTLEKAWQFHRSAGPGRRRACSGSPGWPHSPQTDSRNSTSTGPEVLPKPRGLHVPIHRGFRRGRPPQPGRNLGRIPPPGSVGPEGRRPGDPPRSGASDQSRQSRPFVQRRGHRQL